MIDILPTRDVLADIIPENSKILEIGVFKGEFSNKLLSRNPKELYLVDIWLGSWGSGDKDGNNHVNIDNMEFTYLDIYKKYIEDSRVHVVRSNSTLFLQNWYKDYFDVIYVDGDHEYSAVYSDMVNSLGVIKNGGLLMGHDYHHQIKQAVDKFCIDYNQIITHVTNDGCPSFSITIKK